MDVSPEESSGETEPGLESSLRRKRKGKPKAKGDGIRSRARARARARACACACGGGGKEEERPRGRHLGASTPSESAAPLATIPFSFFCGGKETSRKRGGERIPAGRRARLGDASGRRAAAAPCRGWHGILVSGRPAHARDSSGGMGE